MQGFISHCDLFAPSVDSQLTFNGRRTISSVAGGICTFISIIFIGWFLGLQILNLTDGNVYKA
jgi:hypothetical protein